MTKEKTVYVLYEKYQEYQIDKTLKRRIIQFFHPGKNVLSNLHIFQIRNNINPKEVISYSGYDNVKKEEFKYSFEKINLI